MRNWSIFSNNVRYVQHDQTTPQNLNIDTLDYRDHKELYLKLREEKRETIEIDFGLYPDIIKTRYLDIHEGVYAEMVYANKFNENSDLSTMYLGQTEMMRDTKIKAKERFPISGQGFAPGKLLDGMECQMLVRHRCYKIIHVKILLFVMQNSTCTTPSSLQTHREFMWKWTIC